ncbi:MAG TPA: NBR1-Ig-like domain-containing protein [Anaerolineae bacterium]
MTVHRKYSSIVFLSIVAFLLSACGAGQSESAIATKVAETVAAQNTQAAAVTPTELPALPSEVAMASTTMPGLPADVTAPPPTAPAGTPGANLCTANATFAGETIPDKTIMSPGAVFTKIWHIKNTGTCPWTASWQWVYVSGDLMGGSTYYNFPAPAAPGDTVDVPVVFTAPTDSGEYRGYWEMKSPWGMTFGDSSGNAFWVDIVVGSGTPVNSKTETAYGITDVTIDVTRTCKPANTFYEITANITSDGPVTATFTWVQSDGNNKANNKITFLSAMVKTATREWSQSISSSQNPRWIQVVINSPNYKAFPQVTLPPLCNQP